MQASRWAQVWMSFGLLWFLLAIAFAPTNKIYQQGLTLFLWLPAMVFAWSARERLKEARLGDDLPPAEFDGIAHKVAIAALKFADLSNARTTSYV
mgnify:CR=1 FL=1